jgi:hypothetical protein
MNITEIFSIEPKPVSQVIQLHRKTTVFVFEDNSALYVRINHKHIATTVYISNVLDEQLVANLLARAQDATAYTTARTILEGVTLHNAD